MPKQHLTKFIVAIVLAFGLYGCHLGRVTRNWLGYYSLSVIIAI